MFLHAYCFIFYYTKLILKIKIDEAIKARISGGMCQAKVHMIMSPKLD